MNPKTAFQALFLSSVAILFFTSCSRSKPAPATIIEKPLPTKNPTAYEFNAPVSEVRNAMQLAFANSKQTRMDTYLHFMVPSGSRLLLKGDSSVLSDDILVKSGNENDGYLWSSGDIIGSSEVYFTNGQPLDYTADFHIHLIPLDEKKTRVEIFSYKSLVVTGLDPHGVHGPARIEVRVNPTTIEEYKILLAIGKELGVKDMPALIVPKAEVAVKQEPSRPNVSTKNPSVESLTAPPAELEKPSAPPEPGNPWKNSLGMKFVPVEGTEVLFCIWETRVQDFAAFVTATGYDATANVHSLRKNANNSYQSGDCWIKPGFPQTPKHPVCGVNWNDAKAFCSWLTKKEQEAGHLSEGQEYRLPTDLEWSEAVGLGHEDGNSPAERVENDNSVRARAYEANGTLLGKNYPWGNQWPPPKGAGNFGDDAFHRKYPDEGTNIEGYNDGYVYTAPVGSFDPNKFGIYDLAGNVFEWCEDLYQPDRVTRFWRGGSFFSDYTTGPLESARRIYVSPNTRNVITGFRCVLVVAGRK